METVILTWDDGQASPVQVEKAPDRLLFNGSLFEKTDGVVDGCTVYTKGQTAPDSQTPLGQDQPRPPPGSVLPTESSHNPLGIVTNPPEPEYEDWPGSYQATISAIDHAGRSLTFAEGQSTSAPAPRMPRRSPRAPTPPSPGLSTQQLAEQRFIAMYGRVSAPLYGNASRIILGDMRTGACPYTGWNGRGCDCIDCRARSVAAAFRDIEVIHTSPLRGGGPRRTWSESDRMDWFLRTFAGWPELERRINAYGMFPAVTRVTDHRSPAPTPSDAFVRAIEADMVARVRAGRPGRSPQFDAAAILRFASADDSGTQPEGVAVTNADEDVEF